MSRQEKELRLREAATKLKIRALKQQLLNSTAASGSMVQPPVAGATTRHHDGQPHLHEYYIQQAKEILASCDVRPSLAAQTPHPHHQTTSKPRPSYAPSNSNSSDGPTSHTSSPQSHTPHSYPAHNSGPSPHSPNSHAPSISLHNCAQSSQSSKNHTPSDSSQSSNSSCSHTHSTGKRLTQLVSEPGSSQTTPTQPAVRLLPPLTKSPMPEKLALPEEIKETQYMTAVQLQKVRVNKIRRYMVAATVIQRAWRKRHPRM